MAALTVLSDGPSGDQPGIYYNLRDGETVYITQYRVELTTLSDDVRYELVACSAVNGGGAATAISCLSRISTGAANSGLEPGYTIVDPPLRVTYASGVRSISMRVQTNDANARITAAYHGWYTFEE